MTRRVGLGHLFHRVTDAFAAGAGEFDTAVGHVVYAEGGRVADDDAAEFERTGLERVVAVVRHSPPRSKGLSVIV
jgi:hypothetical protein